MKRNDFYVRALGIEIRAIGPLAILAAVVVVTLLSHLVGRASLF